ncbi:unnamed protein product, partial [Brenthis ino]
MVNTSKVWTRFESKQKDGVTVKLRTQDLPMERMEDAFDFMELYFMKAEAFHVAAGFHRNNDARKEKIEILKTVYRVKQPRIIICCLDDNNPKPAIIGLSSMQLSTNSEKVKDFVGQFQIKTKELRALFDLIILLDELVGAKDFEKYYSGRGISVHLEYRGLGIANELVKVRKLVCIEDDVPMTSAWMTAVGTQKAAEKNNWKTLFEISPDELGRKSGLDFGNKIPTFKLMYTTKD